MSTEASVPQIVGVDCPTRDFRESLTDDEFWPYVLQGSRIGVLDDLDEDDHDVSTTYQADPCPECGEHGACAYDAEGRGMTHITTKDDDDDL